MTRARAVQRRGVLARMLGAVVLAWAAAAAPASAAATAEAAGSAAATAPVPAQAPASVTVGSKRFTESYVLGELVQQALVLAGVPATHRAGLGNTGILEQALASGAIDVYPEYTGTIVRELLRREGAEAAQASLAQINQWLAPRGLKAAVPLGFNNTYALAMREADAAALGVRTLSDLAALLERDPAAAARLRPGLSHEFLVRADGWPGLRAAYGLALQPGTGLDHGLAYEALARGRVDVIDVYSTDAKIARGGLRVLADDRGFFPRYDAVLLMRATLDERALAQALEGRLDEAAMTALNAEVEIDRRPFADVARDQLARWRLAAAASATSTGVGASTGASADTGAAGPGLWARLTAPDLPRLLGQHLALVLGSLVMAVVVAVPAGIWAARRPAVAAPLMALAGVLQTVPSLALLAVLIAALGRIGFVPALLALFVYALLPILRNTHAGLVGVPLAMREAGLALGLRRGQVLRLVELPLALPTLLAGVKTAAVINVGTATVAAFVGAGGLGERIVAGLAVNDTTLMLAGALPAAVLALGVQAGFAVLERRTLRWRQGRNEPAQRYGFG